MKGDGGDVKGDVDDEGNTKTGNNNNQMVEEGKEEGKESDGDGDGEKEKSDGDGDGEKEKSGGDGDGDGDGEKEKSDGEMDLFRLVVVNSYGSQEVQRLQDNAAPLKLTSELQLSYCLDAGLSVLSVCSGQTYIACNWTTEMKEKCYDLETAEVK